MLRDGSLEELSGGGGVGVGERSTKKLMHSEKPGKIYTLVMYEFFRASH